MFQLTIGEFPVKKEQFLLPGAGHGRKMHTAGLLGQRVFKETTKWRAKIHTSLPDSSEVSQLVNSAYHETKGEGAKKSKQTNFAYLLGVIASN